MKVPAITSPLLLAAAFTLAAPAQSSGEYEYIVIGSGPGGGPLAANLARAGHSVLLLEAGGDTGDSLLQEIPAWSTLGAETPGMAWSFFVNHFQDQSQARRDNKYTYRLTNGSYYVGLDPPVGAEPLGILYPRGATVGGSSQLNAMNFALPPDNDWRHIANLTGDQSWAPENMRKLFVEVEKNGYLPGGHQPGHGYDGFISTNLNNVTFVSSRPGVARFVREAISELEGVDVQDEQQMLEMLARDINEIDTKRYEKPGVYSMPLHIDSKRRRSGARNFVAETVAARNRNGSSTYPLTLSTHSLASKILFRPAAGSRKPQAYGVEYIVGDGLYSADGRYNATQSGEVRRAQATREVIVAAGSFNTPQILKLSGIGPQQELQKLGIPVVANVPAVGNYMQDNYEGGVSIRANIPYENNPFANCRFNPALPASEDPCLQQWQTENYGPYGEGGAPLSMWFKSSVSENKDCDVFLFGAASADFRGYFPGFSREQVPDSNFFWSMVKMQPGNQVGTVTLRSTNPRESPLINFNFFQEKGDRDLQALEEAHDMVMRVFNATGAPYTPITVVEPHSGADTKQALKDYTFSHHVSSTCRMGPADHPDYCVDSNFRVNGVDGLRVVDASVFPRSPGAFPVAPTFLISQKAFHLLLSGA
ncbi:L-sorbose 1-dehydrogenase-like protein [Cladobotryum mycophilum]|uniref:L-sorbose 1-dehydrogenase-like protein n=1 Tax=Cladobotryum mycophilum TaxID=491253 RepID=A0ABR0SQM3_9HYPO